MTHDEQLRALEQVFLRLRKYNLKLNLGKSVFGAAEVNYLGYTLTGDAISPGKEKLKAIQDFPPHRQTSRRSANSLNWPITSGS